MPSRFFDVIQDYSEEDIYNLINEVEKLLENEKNLISIPKGKTMVVGDLHGDLETLNKIINVFFKEKFQTLIFLGDYVDRGAKQVEVVNVLFYYKKLYPDRIFLLRGNHEDPIINRQYGFYDEIRLKFRNSYSRMFQKYNQLFAQLPFACITWNKIFCVHGGIPEGLEYIEDINSLPSNQEKIKNPITKQLVWNDPKERLTDFKNSTRGKGVKKFGKEAFEQFVKRNKIKYVIRAHEKFKAGFKTYFDDKLISIFSSQSYSKKVTTVVGVIKKQGDLDILSL